MAKRIWCRWRAPQSMQQPPNHGILLVIFESAQGCTGPAPLQEHGAELVVGLQEAHGWVAIPEAQASNLVGCLHGGHTNLENGGCPVRRHDGHHIGTSSGLTVELHVPCQIPSTQKFIDQTGKALEPEPSFASLRTVGCEVLRNLHFHTVL